LPVLRIGLVLCDKRPTRELSVLPDVVLAAVVVIAAVGVIDPPPPPSGGVFPDLDQKRCVAGREKDLESATHLA
jgi:hypothetical protein